MSKEAKKLESDDHTEAMTEAPTVAEKGEHSQDEVLVHVMHDHLDVMLAIIMKIREDPEYASNIYSDCPRLQHILDQHPDLRPVFEDPKFIRVNFEQVYRKAGGILPEDKPGIIMRVLRCVVNHPLFKILKVFLFIKKIVSCIFGGGIGFLTSMCFPNPANFADATAQGNETAYEGSPENQESRESLYHAADYMEQPEVQEKMRVLLESNPENLEEAIEQDPELKALRDSNPLCAELMKDPETMQILVDPENLRALAECPDLVEQDFNDPNWTPPEVQPGTFDETTVVPAEEVVTEELEVEGEEDEEGMEIPEMEAADDERSGMQGSRSARSLNSSKRTIGSRGSSIYTNFKDYVAAEIVGSGADSMMGLDAVDTSAVDQASAAAESAEANASHLESVADMAGNVEDTMDKIEETHDDKLADSNMNMGVVATSTAAGGAAGVAAATAASPDNDKSEASSSFRSEIGSIFSSFHAAAKETLATTLLGDDMGEHLLEKMEENEEDAEEEEGNRNQSSRRRLGSLI